MSDLYIPPGYVSTPHAITELFGLRYPDLVTQTAALEEEERQLYALKTAYKPPPITTISINTKTL